MLRNKIIYLIILIGAIVYASFFGGNISYMFLHLVIMIPIVSLAYTYYVFSRFMVGQDIPVRQVTKGDIVPYNFVVENRDIFSFVKVKVTFAQDVATIEGIEEIQDHCMLPNTYKSYDKTIMCKYRGTYYIGAQKLEITDFFYLFKVKYQVPSMVRFTVQPRVVIIDRLKAGIDAVDSKNMKTNTNFENTVVDNDLRKYVAGDNRKLIHWKNSAKKKELLTRKYIDEEMFEAVILLDTRSLGRDDSRIAFEDKIIETGLAIAHNYTVNNVTINIVYENNRINIKQISNMPHFHEYLDLSATMKFNGEKSVGYMLEEYAGFVEEMVHYMIITCRVDEELINSAMKSVARGNKVTVIYIEEFLWEEAKNIPAELDVIRIPRDEDIVKILSA